MHESTVDKSRSAQAREDTLAMFRQMPVALGVLVVVYFLATMAWFAAPAIVPTWFGSYALRMLAFMGLAFGAAPVLKSLYRFVAVGEVRMLPALDFDPPTRIFAAYASLMTALYFLPPLGREIVNAMGGYGDIAWFILVPVVWVIVIRASTLLPMAALDPQNVSWARALAQTKGKTLSTFLATTVPALPAFIVLLIVAALAARGAIHPIVFYPVAILTLLAVQLLPLSATTRLYLDERRRESEPN